KQMLDYVFNSHLLLPVDLRGIANAICCLQPSTAGSLGLDLATAVDVTLMTNRPTKIPTGVCGPTKINGTIYGALLLGRSSASLMGLFVLPGLIDADYCEKIQIMAYTLYPPLNIPKRQRIAQLVPLPQMTASICPKDTAPREDKGFG
ncbi:POK9 protein, partial [Locustella ochotensis]|nr:POK9 protein [Locustella ochotensis]